MSTTKSLPRPSLPPCAPPSAALPPLPIPKSRKSLGNPQVSGLASPTPQSPSKLAIRTPSRATIPSAAPKSQHAYSTPAIPTLKTSGIATAGPTPERTIPERTIRKTVSIASFPQPPKSSSKIATLPGRPLLGGSGSSSVAGSYRRVSDDSICSATPVASVRSTKLKPTNGPVAQKHSYSGNNVPTLLNGSGDAVSISAGLGHRGSDGLLSLPSPDHSRVSSAQDSYSTSATTFEDMDDAHATRGRGGAKDASNPGRLSIEEENEKGNVIVSVRVRPEANGSIPNASDWEIDGSKSMVSYRGRDGGDYYYDNVFGVKDQNAKVYDVTTKRLVRRVMEGYHGTVFAYGITGSGKTYTMQGTRSSPGVMVSAITDLFGYIRETPSREFLLRVSYLEIYNEKIHDLLAAAEDDKNGVRSSQQEEIKLHDDGKGGVYAAPLREELVQSPNELKNVIARGAAVRRTSSTQYNADSSRSHAVVQVVVESRLRRGFNGNGREDKRAAIVPGGVQISTLSLIDLAGSERAASNKDRQKEGQHINQSLLTLGKVIAGLSSDKSKQAKHVPYRESKLTRLLQPALCGKSLVSILCTIQVGGVGTAALANAHTAETLNTLKFAARAKNNIVSHARKAEAAMASGSEPGFIEIYQKQIEELQQKLAMKNQEAKERRAKDDGDEDEKKHHEYMREQNTIRAIIQGMTDNLNRLIVSSQSKGVNSDDKPTPMSLSPMSPTNEFGARSLRSPASYSTLRRTTSGTSESTATAGIHTTLQSSSPAFGSAHDADSASQNPDGSASLQEQIHALRHDIADKNRYILVLERRVHQARRTSQARSSILASPVASLADSTSSPIVTSSPLITSSSPTAETGNPSLTSLRAQLSDKESQLTALLSTLSQKETLINEQTIHIATLNEHIRLRDCKITSLRTRITDLRDKVSDLTHASTTHRLASHSQHDDSISADGLIFPAPPTPILSISDISASREPETASSKSPPLGRSHGHAPHPSTSSSHTTTTTTSASLSPVDLLLTSPTTLTFPRIPARSTLQSPLPLASPKASNHTAALMNLEIGGKEWPKRGSRESIDQLALVLDLMIQERVEKDGRRQGSLGGVGSLRRGRGGLVEEKGGERGDEEGVEGLAS